MLSVRPTTLTTVGLDVHLVAVPQDALIAGHGARDGVGISGASALDLTRHRTADTNKAKSETRLINNLVLNNI